MKVGVTSQNFRTITGHAGKARRFMLYEGEPGGEAIEAGRLDLPKEMSMHEFRGPDPHPVAELDVLITQGCGEGFRRKMLSYGVTLVTTSESDPQLAVNQFLRGEALSPAAPHEH